MSLYSVAHKCLAGFFRFAYGIKVTGKEHEPTEGPVLVCANHLSNHDVIILGSSLKRSVRFFAKAELFKVPVVGALVKALGAFPIQRGDAVSATATIKFSLNLLNDGEMVGIYPQGTRHPGVDPRTTEVKGGIGMLAYRSKATVLPVLIRTKSWKCGFFRRTWVTIGKPISFEELGMTAGRGAEYQKAAELIFSRITDLIPDSIPAPAVHEDGNEH